MATSKSGSSKGPSGKKPPTRSARAPGPKGAQSSTRAGAASAASTAADVAADAIPKATARAERAAERAAEATRRAANSAATAAMDASRRALEATPTIVLKAATIIEEEVAMGIGAAKRIEQRFLDVEALRAQNPDHVMSKFRKDAHDAVDIILDIVTAAATTVSDRAGRMVNVTASRLVTTTGGPFTATTGATSGTEAAATKLATVRMPGTIAPGQTAELMMSLENESDSATADFTLHSSELVSSGGERIPSSAVTFEPPTLAVGPRAAGTVTVRVRVPADAKGGSYEGLLRATQLSGLRAMLTVDVG